jgi:hypothetical protein
VQNSCFAKTALEEVFSLGRFANIMKELMLMPEELKKTHGCSMVISEYAHSFQVQILFSQCKQLKLGLAILTQIII